VTVATPNADCILADKLTAFAPHTTGIPFGDGKELEIIKQLYDIASLIDFTDDFSEIKATYRQIVKAEIEYRGISADASMVLLDSIDTAACIAGRGKINGEEYSLLQKGVADIRNHIYSEKFNGEIAIQRACMVMYVAAAILTDQPTLPTILEKHEYAQAIIKPDKFKKLAHVKKTDSVAYWYLIEATNMLFAIK
jgi:hypothetical protein